MYLSTVGFTYPQSRTSSCNMKAVTALAVNKRLGASSVLFFFFNKNLIPIDLSHLVHGANTRTDMFIKEWFGSSLVHQCEQNHRLGVEVALNDMALYQTSE